MKNLRVKEPALINFGGVFLSRFYCKYYYLLLPVYPHLKNNNNQDKQAIYETRVAKIFGFIWSTHRASARSKKIT